MVSVQKYKGFLIVSGMSKGKSVDLIRPNGGFRVVKSEQAAKWRITRALNVAIQSKLV